MSSRTIIAGLILIGVFVAISYDRKNSTVSAPITTCATDTMRCPDGSSVNRTGVQCEFAACPTVTPPVVPPKTQKSVVKGAITVSPGCGIQTDPPSLNCGPHPYQTTISFSTTNNMVFRTTTNSAGEYSISLSQGTYTMKVTGGEIYPSCPVEKVVVPANTTVTKDVDCNSGIL